MKKRAIFKISAAFILLFLLLTLAFTACKKTDVLTNTIHYNTNQPKDFFEAQPGTDALTNRVLANIKRRNEQNEFVQEFAHKYGYPVWNKTLQQEVIKRRNLQAFVQENTSDTLVYISLVLEGASKVNGYILARLSDSIAISYSLAQDYLAYSFTQDNSQSLATRYAVKIMLLNNAVFGTNHFEVNDTRLFCKDTALPERSTVSIIKMPDANGLTTGGVNGLLTQICWDLEIAYYYCGTKDYCRAHGGCDAI